MNNLHWLQANLSDWQFTGDWKSGGTFKARDQLRHTPLMVKGNFNLRQFDLTR